MEKSTPTEDRAPVTDRDWYVGGASTDGSHVDIKGHGRFTAVCNGVPLRAAGVIVEEHNREIAAALAARAELAAENARLQGELDFQTKNAAEAHAERARQFRRAADLMEVLAFHICDRCQNRIGFDPDPKTSPYPPPCTAGGCVPLRAALEESRK